MSRARILYTVADLHHFRVVRQPGGRLRMEELKAAQAAMRC